MSLKTALLSAYLGLLPTAGNSLEATESEIPKSNDELHASAGTGDAMLWAAAPDVLEDWAKGIRDHSNRENAK